MLNRIPDKHIDLTYIDPPFSTGKTYKARNGEVAYKDKYDLTELIDFLIPIIKEIKRTLKDTGLFYLHGDSRFIHYIKIECDKIFGKDNFRNEIIWFYNSGARKKKDFGRRHDTILRYSKTNNYYFDDTQAREPYSKTAPRGYAKEKYYNDLGKVKDDVWNINMLAQNDKTERIGYPTQKPLELLDLIVNTSCPKNGLVADFFAGSGTTLISALKNQRNFIGCDNSNTALEYFYRRTTNTEMEKS